MKPVAISMVLDWLRAEGLLQDVASQAVLRVAPSTVITGFASVDLAEPGDASFWVGDTVKNETNANGFASSLLDSVRAGLLFVPQGLMPAEKVAVASGKEFAPGVGCIVPVENPYHAMVCFLEKFADSFAGGECAGDVTSGSFAGGECAGDVAKSARVHASAVVEGRVGENAFVGPGCVVMRGATLGAGCVLEANVTIYPNVVVGEDCVFQAGAVIGSRGFGFYEYEGRRRPVPHLAGVRIGRGCSFGANTVVAAGFLSPTTIGENCHIDSFVQIAHNCRLGNNIFMARGLRDGRGRCRTCGWRAGCKPPYAREGRTHCREGGRHQEHSRGAHRIRVPRRRNYGMAPLDGAPPPDGEKVAYACLQEYRICVAFALTPAGRRARGCPREGPEPRATRMLVCGR